MKLYYFWDAYCGWCYGFKEILEPFLANHSDLSIEVISGGLFNQNQPVSAYPFMANTNERIAEIFGVSFGESYQDLLDEGRIVLNSTHAAIGYSILRELLPNQQWVELAGSLQKCFYQDGKSLSDVATYIELAQQYNLDSEYVAKQFTAQKDIINQHSDFLRTQTFGVSSYPTLVLEKDGDYFDLRGNAMTVEELEKNFVHINNL